MIIVSDHAATQTAISSASWWFLMIAAAALGAWLRWLAPVAIFVFYLLLHASGGGGVHLNGTALGWLIVAAVSVFIGLQVGGRAMLRHVGERQFRTQVAGAKTVSGIWRYWFGDRL